MIVSKVTCLITLTKNQQHKENKRASCHENKYILHKKITKISSEFLSYHTSCEQRDGQWYTKIDLSKTCDPVYTEKGSTTCKWGVHYLNQSFQYPSW